jgi:hypothetical protein
MVVTTVAGSPCRTVTVHQSHGISGRKDGGTVPASLHYDQAWDRVKGAFLKLAVLQLTLLNAR